MAVQLGVQAAGDVERLQADLRAAVLHELAERQLDTPDALADCLDVLPIAADGLLRRPKWSVETALWVIEKVNLPIQVSISRP